MSKSKSKVTHVHRYIRATQPGPKKLVIYRCVMEGNCSHYVYASELPGREAKCWRCLKAFIVPVINPEKLPKRPHCALCTKKYNYVKPRGRDPIPEVSAADIAELSMEDLLKDIT